MKKTGPFQILYEDDHIIAADKAPGISVIADRWDESRERLDKLLAASTGAANLFVVHRIDRGTSGLVVFAKDAAVHKKLSAAFEGRRVKKRYIAVIRGRPDWKETICDLPLVPDGNKKHLTIIDKYMGKKSLTRFRLLLTAGNYSVVEAVPETGRTHQIRVHLAGLGHSIVCDEFYGNAKPVLLSSFKRGWRGDPLEENPLLSRLGLHAAELFIPGYANGLNLKAPLPRDMVALIRQMEKAGLTNIPIGIYH